MKYELDGITSMAVALMAMAGVAALGNDLSHLVYYSVNPMPYKMRQELEGKYGHWAVSIAIAACPLGDIECIEREAKRLSEVRRLRR